MRYTYDQLRAQGAKSERARVLYLVHLYYKKRITLEQLLARLK